MDKSLFEKLIRKAQRSVLPFCMVMNRDFSCGQHHYRIAQRLDEIARGIPRRIIIAMPPRHGKSELASCMFPSFYLGKNPTKKVILTAYSQYLVNDFGVRNRNNLKDEVYSRIFDTRLDQSTSAKNKFVTTAGGGLNAMGLDGGVTGMGGDLIIIDDLIKGAKEASSKAHRKKIIDHWQQNLRNRLHPGGSIIVINTRWHTDDFIGYLLKESEEDWEYLKMDAISPGGQALWPERFPMQELLILKKEMGTRAFEALYQQNPTIAEGNIIKREWIKRYEKLPPRLDEWIITADLTFKGEDDSKQTDRDYVAIQCWARLGANMFYVDGVRGRWDFNDMLRHFQIFLKKHSHVTKIKVEDAANAAALYSVLKNKIPGISLWKPKTKKEFRLEAVSPLYEQGNILYPEEFHQDEEYFTELFEFPRSKHDDMVDATTMAQLLLQKSTKSYIVGIGTREY